VQEIDPTELHEITLETYTSFKTDYTQAHKDTKIGFGTLGEYIDRLEYELKVIKEM
jgi:DNA polymerase III alpha subunit